MIKLERAVTDDNILQILDLQKRNLKKNLSEEDIQSQGFVTAEHTFEQLKKINDLESTIIATDNGKVIAYAIAMKREAGEGMEVFKELFETVDSLEIDGKAINNFKYIFVGQLCIDKTYRGQKLVEKLYGFFKEELKERYNFALTDISEHNPRSFKAHLNSGFKYIHTFYDEFTKTNWNIVMLDFSI
ncbi:GNAT family N-acetyltransferase [Lacihabitans sp. LS3-19]|uniref:GNAT family N-acetyltransferase n=1 Tax=Lacihabitans sp. LS3-19 TaxID=2487335 RepID=UPI0020CF1951|nr:GNAT family N-acetyltransferase [Lacihabitans sp. LS3-19]MCP9767874.1 GNAT family N-acetyltransferase [Lacihabitans sp. LS3-19]